MTQPDNTYAFPMQAGDFYAPGMTLRDYFAGQVMTGIASTLHMPGEPLWYKMADEAYTFADAMLAARKQKA